MSDELTEKHRDLTKCEREKLDAERELLQLRPLKAQLDNFSENNRAQIEMNCQFEFERNKLQKLNMELLNDVERMKSDLEQINDKNLTLN